MIDLRISYNKLITCVSSRGIVNFSTGECGDVDGYMGEVIEGGICNLEKEY